MPARTASNTGLSDRRPTRGAALLVLCSLLLGAPCARALELGPLSVHSTLGERLRAEVEIASVDGDDLDGVRASLADIATYERFGVPRPDVLSTVDVSLRTDEDGTPIVRIGSSAPVHELFLNVLLRIEERDVRLIREVAILLDPLVTHAMPGWTDGTALAAPSEGAAYTVRVGDSLMRIAERFAPPETSAEQTAVALYEANPEAFLGSIHRLIVGASLTLPPEAAVRAHSPWAARRVIRKGIEAFQRRLAGDDPLPVDTAARPGDTTTRAGSPDGGAAASPPPADPTVPPLEDDLALQDFQAVIVNLKGSLYELQGTLDERVERLDGLHAQIDELIGERVRIRASAERDALEARSVRAAEQAAVEAESAARAAEQAARQAAERAAAAARRAAERIDAGAVGPLAEERIATLDVRPGPGAGAVEPRAPAPEVSKRPGRPGSAEAIDARGTRVELSSAPLARDDRPPIDAAGPTPTQAAGLESLARANARKEKAENPASVSSASLAAAAPGDADDPARSADPGTASAASPIDGRQDGGLNERRSHDVSSIRSALSRWTLERSMQTFRDGGLLVLALCMVYVLFSHRHRKGESPEGTPLDVGAALDFYLSQSSDERVDAEMLQSLLARSPDRQDIRLRLLEMHARDGSMTRFAAEAQTMYRMTRGDTPEWHRVVELGLGLDAGIDFYRIVVDDDPFDLKLDLGLSDEDRVSSVPAGTDVGRGDRFAPVASFAEFFAQNNSVKKSDEGALFAEAAGPDDAPDESPWGPEDVSSARSEDVPPVLPEDFAPVAPADFSPAPPSSTASTPPEDVPSVPLAGRPVYVPEDASELIAISVNYAYGVDKLDVDLGERNGEATIGSSRPDSVSLPVSDDDAGNGGTDEHVDAGGTGPDVAMPIDALATVEPVRRHDDLAAGFMDFESSLTGGEAFAIATEGDTGTDSDDLMIDIGFRRDDVGLQLDLAETYAENGCDEEARRLLDAALPRADADQRTRADALAERLSGRRESDRAFG